MNKKFKFKQVNLVQLLLPNKDFILMCDNKGTVTLQGDGRKIRHIKEIDLQGFFMFEEVKKRRK